MRRILFTLLTTFIISLVVFFLSVRIPESRLEAICEDVNFQDGTDCLNTLKHELSLDKTIYQHYWNWTTGMLTGDFGQSIWTSRYLINDFAQRLPVTFTLLLLSFIFSQVISLPLGLLASVLHSKVALIVSRIIELIFTSVPIFWLTTLMILFPSWFWSPPQKYVNFSADPLGNLKLLVVPSMVLGLYISGIILSNYLQVFSEVQNMNYIRTASSKGLRKRIVFMRHGFRNALVPSLKRFAALLPFTLSIIILVEGTIALPGVSRLFIQAIDMRDFPIIAGTLFILACFCLVVFQLTVLVCAWLDPRLRHSDLQQPTEYL